MGFSTTRIVILILFIMQVDTFICEITNSSNDFLYHIHQHMCFAGSGPFAGPLTNFPYSLTSKIYYNENESHLTNSLIFLFVVCSMIFVSLICIGDVLIFIVICYLLVNYCIRLVLSSFNLYTNYLNSTIPQLHEFGQIRYFLESSTSLEEYFNNFKIYQKSGGMKKQVHLKMMKDDFTCAICLLSKKEIKEKEKGIVCLLPCYHCCCGDCFDQYYVKMWRFSKKNCHICRQGIENWCHVE